MQVGLSVRQVSTSQQALTLLNKAQEAAAALQEKGPGTNVPWITSALEKTVSGRAAAAIQELVQNGPPGTTTFRELGGKERTVPADEYQFFAENQAQSLEQVLKEFIEIELISSPQVISQAISAGRLDDARERTAWFDTLKRSMANGTLKIELLDDRVAQDIEFFGVRDSTGRMAGMDGRVIQDIDWQAFDQVYRSENGGSDRHMLVGSNYWIRGYVISWEK
jgi:hypothetical protein